MSFFVYLCDERIIPYYWMTKIKKMKKTLQRFCYVSRNYYNMTSAGNKAKIDYEEILTRQGARNVGLPRRVSSNKIMAFFYNLVSVVISCFRMKRGDIMVIQYPLKKYFSFLCKITHIKRAHVLVLIHDLGSFRRKKLTMEHEIRRLSHADYVIATNEVMAEWLRQHGLEIPVDSLGLHDYLSFSCARPHDSESLGGEWNLVYAGSLNVRKNAFIYQLPALGQHVHLHLYGNAINLDSVLRDNHIEWHGYMSSDDFIERVEGDFGLVWDGDSLECCEGDFGSYLRYNTPHKASFYLKAGLPLIVWSQSAIAPLVRKLQIGVVVDSLKNLDTCLCQITPCVYAAMRKNVDNVSRRIGDGEFLQNALRRALDVMGWVDV